jgi:hypothetical protein
MLSWDTYTVTIQFNDRCIGGIPIASENGRIDVYRGWLKGQDIEDDPTFTKPLAEALADDPDMPVASDDEVVGISGFRRDDNGLYIEARQVKAMLKEAAQRLGYVKAKRGARQVLQHDLHVRASNGAGQKLYLGKSEPDGIETRPIAVVTPQGPRSSIKAFEFVTNEQRLSWRVRVLADGIGNGIIGEDELSAMLELGQELGLGADRSQGEGTFTLERFERET